MGVPYFQTNDPHVFLQKEWWLPIKKVGYFCMSLDIAGVLVVKIFFCFNHIWEYLNNDGHFFEWVETPDKPCLCSLDM